MYCNFNTTILIGTRTKNRERSNLQVPQHNIFLGERDSENQGTRWIRTNRIVLTKFVMPRMEAWPHKVINMKFLKRAGMSINI